MKNTLMKTLGGKTWLLSPLSENIFAVQGELILKSINGRKNVLLIKSRTHKYFRRELRNGKWYYIYNEKKNTSKTRYSKISEEFQNIKNNEKDLIKNNNDGFSDFKTEVIDVFKKYTNKEIFVGKDLQDLNGATMLTAINGIKVVFEEFPQLGKIFKGFNITTHKNTIMGCRPDDQFNGTIVFHYSYMSYEKALERINQSETVSSKMALTGSKTMEKLGMQSMGIHEAGHLLEMLLVRLNTKYKSKKERETAWNNRTEAEIIIKRALSSKEFKGQDEEKFKLEISFSAADNDGECLAEAVADVCCNNGQAADLSIRIVEELEKRLKELNSLNKLNKLTKSLMRRIRNVFR